MNDSVVIAAPLLIAAIVTAVRFVGCRFVTTGIPGTGQPGTPEGGIAVDFTGSGSLVVRASSPNNPVTTTHTTPGQPDPYSIPDWCNYIDLILLGGGGGGITNGNGGSGGLWTAVTLTRGINIPWTTPSITITVGAGGPAGSDGGETTATAAGLTIATPTAGGGKAGGSTSGFGESPGNFAYQGQTYTGGGSQNTGDSDGIKPGGGASAGPFPGKGADGEAWVVARQI
jgi:hypothetical protein